MTQLTYEGEKERKRGRQSEKYQTTIISKYIELKVRMHKHVTCTYKFIMGLAQSKPISTQHCNKYSTHL